VPSPTLRSSLSGVEECYRGRHVRVFRLNRELVLSRLRSAATRLLHERADVVEVWLFGSLARHEAQPGSDADVLIIVREATEPFLKRGQGLAAYFSGVGVGCDLLVYTGSEARDLSGDASSLLSIARREGLRLAPP
jgi:predicted nucleotidyltransferase